MVVPYRDDTPAAPLGSAAGSHNTTDVSGLQVHRWYPSRRAGSGLRASIGYRCYALATSFSAFFFFAGVPPGVGTTVLVIAAIPCSRITFRFGGGSLSPLNSS
jgi:hypothetical protein